MTTSQSDNNDLDTVKDELARIASAYQTFKERVQEIEVERDHKVQEAVRDEELRRVEEIKMRLQGNS